MKALRPWLLVLASIAGLAGAGAASAAPVRNTFYDCGSDISCANATLSVIVQFTTDDILVAPQVPPPGQFTSREPVPVTQRLAGGFDELSLETFNINNAIGGLFVFDNLEAANGLAFSPVMAIAPATRTALHLVWQEGSYLGLGYVNCFNTSCSAQSRILGFTKLVVERADTHSNTVPEPQSLALVLGALAAGWGVRARRLPRQAGRG